MASTRYCLVAAARPTSTAAHVTWPRAAAQSAPPSHMSASGSVQPCSNEKKARGVNSHTATASTATAEVRAAASTAAAARIHASSSDHRKSPAAWPGQVITRLSGG